MCKTNYSYLLTNNNFNKTSKIIINLIIIKTINDNLEWNRWIWQALPKNKEIVKFSKVQGSYRQGVPIGQNINIFWVKKISIKILIIKIFWVFKN